MLYAVEWSLFLFAFKKFRGVFFSPSVYTLGVFIVSTSLCLYCVNFWQIHFYPITFIILSCGLGTVVFAESLFSCKKEKNINRCRYFIKIPSPIKIGLSIYCILATFLYFREVQIIGLAHSMAVNEAIANVKADWQIYENQFNPLVRQGYKMVMAIAYCYTFIFVNNYNVCKRKFRETFWFIIPLFCGVIINLISGSRGDMIRMLLLFLFAYYICKWQASQWKVQPTKQILKIALPAFAIVLLIFFSARLFVKVDVDSQKKIGGPVEYLAYYIGSPIQVFNIHAEQLRKHVDVNYNSSVGVSCFGGIYSLLQNLHIIGKHDVQEHKIGVGFEELGGKSNAAGNVDAIFASSYVDFGLIGMCVYIFVIYSLFSYFFYRKILYEPLTLRYVKNFILFSFFYYEVEMSFYCDVAYLIISQTGFLQLMCLLILMHFIVRPQYFIKL